MKAFLRRLMYGGSARLRGYEAACLGAWSRTLPPEGREILARQLARFSLVQRQSGDRLVMFYDVDDREYAGWPADALFPLREQEQRAAWVWLRPAAGGQRLRCDVVLHRGRLSSLEFARAPVPLFPGAVRESVPLAEAGGTGEVEGARVDAVEQRLDPLHPHAASAAPAPAVEGLTGWLREWAARWTLEGLKAPLSPAERESWEKEEGVALPAGYRELVAQTDGVRVGPVTVYALGDVRRVLLPDHTAWLLADVPGRGELGLLEEDPAAGLFFFGDSDEPEPAGSDFRETLERVLDRAPGR